MIRVLVADDHAIVRRGLVQLVDGAEDLEVVAEAADGNEAIAAAATHAPDVVLMDLSMPNTDGVEATRAICAQGRGAAVVILTSFSEQARILDAVAAGAVGYLLKDAEPGEILRGIRAAASGDSPFSPRAARALLTVSAQRSAAAELTGRERQVLACVAEGMPNKLIARRLGISEKTVKAHLGAVFQRIGVTDRTQAALWAHRHGVVPPEARS